MTDNLNIEDIQKLIAQQQGGQNAELDLEKLLNMKILDPQIAKVIRTRVVPTNSNGVISEMREGTSLNKDGIIEEQKQFDVVLLDDGTTIDGNVTRCQACGNTIHEINSRVCPCGQRVCTSKGCAKYSKKTGLYYCCTRHAILDRFGWNLRFW